ncbi:MAG: hypothetical protein KDB01_22875, partial [Planctomycetaceae bacterium]|nr:hypothetical protein [Planctomycetaceae bacterium]
SGTWATTATALTTDAASLVQFSGSITASGGNMNFSGGGLLHLLGGTLLNGSLTIAAGSRLQLSGGTLNGFTITNSGNATWTSGNVILINGSAFNNAGTFDDQTDGTFGSDDAVCPDFTNSGTFIKSGGNGVTQMKTDFLNSGLVEIQQGILNIGCGYVQTGGSTVVTGGAITGPVEVQGGSIEGPITGDVVNSGEVSITPSETPTTTSSYTQSGLGSLTEQIGGLISGIEYGQIQVSGDVNLAGSLFVSLINGFRPQLSDEFLIILKQSGGAINGTFSGLPEGSTVWAGVYGFEISYVGGDGNDVTLKVTHSPIVIWDGNTDGDGDGISWNDPLNWANDVLPGLNDDVIIGSGFTVTHADEVTSAVRSIESHSPLTLSGGTLSVTAESNFTGGLILSGGGLLTTANIQIGDLAWTSGTLQGIADPMATVTGTVSAMSDIDLRNITLDLTNATLAGGANQLDSLRLEDATLLRAEAWTVDGPFVWMGGTLDAGSGVGSLIANGGMMITGGDVLNFAVTNTGLAVWSAGNVTFVGNSSFTNAIGANFDDQTDGSFGGVHPHSVCPIFYNEGTYTKSGGNGTTDLEMELHNRGEVRVELGTLNLTCGYVQVDNGTIGGVGTGGPGGGTVAFADFHQSSSGILIEQIAGTEIGDYGQIIVTGSVTLAGTLGVELLNGFIPSVGDTFIIIDNRGTGQILGEFIGLPEGAVVWAGNYGFMISYVGGIGENDVVLTALAPPSDFTLSGLVFVDLNNDSQVNYGEAALAGVQIDLMNEAGTVIATTFTNSQGIYEFTGLAAGRYTIIESQPEGYTQGINSVGTLGGTISAVDQFFVELSAAGDSFDGMNYNFAELPTASNVHAGQTASIGFWQNKNGQALIKAMNGGGQSNVLGNWLAATFPNMYGAAAGVSNLTGKTNTQVAAFYVSLFKRNGQTAPAGPPKTDAQVLATALAVYVTNSSLAGNVAAAYGFEVSANGVGSATFNVTTNGAAFGVTNGSTVTVMDLILAVNTRTRRGLLFDLDDSGTISNAERSFREMANSVFSGINETGEI